MSIKAVLLLTLLSVPACFLVKHFFPVPAEYLGFWVGIGLFLINLLMVSVLIKKFLAGAASNIALNAAEELAQDGSNKANKRKKGVGGFLFLGSMKFLVLGIGIYFALAVFKYSPIFLVAGGAFGLLLAAGLLQFNNLGQKS